MGSFIIPISISQLLRYPVWSPVNIIFQSTAIATPVVMLGEYRMSANIVLGILGRLASPKANKKART